MFAGRFSLNAAEEVCAEVSLERPDVVNALIGLVDKSVVLREGEQYRMLDTLREFGAERLAASGRAEAIEYEDEKGKWHTETASGSDRPETEVKDGKG